MYEEFFADRVALLREHRDVSARDMSLTLGQNRNYINQIENKKTLPSMQVFFYICEYFGITPKEFFDDGVENPVRMKELVDDLRQLDSKMLEHIAGMVKEIINTK